MIWNPSTCMCECNKYCEVGQYLDYKSCVCSKKLIDDLIEQCTSIVDLEIKNGISLLSRGSISDNASKSSTNVYLFLFVVLLIVLILLIARFIYYCRKENSKKVDDKIYDVAYSNTSTLIF